MLAHPRIARGHTVLDFGTHLSRRRRAVDKGGFERFQPLEMITMDMAEKACQRSSISGTDAKIVDYKTESDTWTRGRWDVGTELLLLMDGNSGNHELVSSR